MANTEKELDIELIKKRAIYGVVSFTLRTFFIQVFTFGATFILTILLAPEVFGIFFVVSAILNFFVYFSDIGLAAALIQKKQNPSRDDFVTTFTIQQAMVGLLILVGLLLSSKIAQLYNLNSDGLVLMRVLLFSLLLSSLKTIPSIRLERDLSFGKLIIPQIAENIVFYSTAVFLAFLGFGLASFSWAVLARGVTGLILVYILAPWLPAIGFNRFSAKKLISFGIPFQLNSVLALIKDDLLVVFIGKILPFAQVGYIGWGQRWAFLPLRFFVDNVNRVTFPVYSRLQTRKDELGKAIEKSIFFVIFFVYPSIFGMLALAPKLIDLIPNYEKWEPALPLLYFFAVNAVFSAVSTSITNTLFAIGKPRIVLKFMIFWTIATWALTYPAIVYFGYVGVGVASALVASTSLFTIYIARKYVTVKLGFNVFGPLLISIIMALIVKGLLVVLPQNIPSLFLAIIAGAIIYFAISFSVYEKHVKEEAQTIIKSFLFPRKYEN